MRLNTTNLSPMQLGRLNAVLAKRSRFSGVVRTLGEHLATLEGKKSTGDGMVNWNRRHFNQMLGDQQRAYEARLKAQRFYYVDGWQVPKIVYDVVED